ALLGATMLAACGGGGGGGVDATGTITTNHAELERVEFGRLVDVYGLSAGGAGSTIELYQRDVVIHRDIRDERESSDNLRDEEILYDFIGSDPDTLQPRLFI